jgi:histidyl-tRNA synthetase
MSKTLQAIRGMNDILPAESVWWEWLEDTVRDWLAAYGYRNIRMPLVEPTELFVRSIGEVTDIVEKEMYTFIDGLNGDSLTLRPEGTASCLRAVQEHNLLYNGPQRLWYAGPMFRHERPQKGRYRQFHQVGVEALGFAGPDTDAELLIMTADLWQRLGVTGLELQLNTLGSSAERASYRTALVSYLAQHQDVLDEDARRRLHTNPLRVLDSKNPAMREMIAAAPLLQDYLQDTSRAHFDGLCQLLAAAEVSFTLNPRLVRGLDYYNLTVFEWVTQALGAQGTVCAGGRYDGLIEQLGGKPAPAAGFGIGVERLLLLLQAQGKALPDHAPHVYLVHQGETAVYAQQLASTLRRDGLHVVLHCGGGSFKSQFKKADASGARWAVVVGDDEVREQVLTLKPLRHEGEQQRLSCMQASAIIRSVR